jgi:O-antigen ligase
LKKIVPHITHANIAFVACLGVIIGLYTGKAIMSISVTLLMVNAIINKSVIQNIKNTFSQKIFVAILILFMLYVLSGFNSTNMHMYGHKIQLHLPFLALPFGFACMPFFDKQKFHLLFLTFIILTALGCIYSLAQYMHNKAAIDAAYSFSKVMPTPFKSDHIRFSVAVVMAILCCIILMPTCVKKWQHIALGFAILFFTTYLHILAVKTGLLCFYILVAVFIYYFIVVKKYFRMGLLLLAAIILIPILAYYTSNTFRNKIYYMQYSFVQMKNAHTEINVSDEGRMVSYELGLDILKNNFLFGVGAGDVQDEMTKALALKKGKLNTQSPMLLPHNQLLMMGLVAGVLGFVAYLFFLLIPLFTPAAKHFNFVAAWLIFLVPQMVEPLHETQYGITVHVFILLLLYVYYSPQKPLNS